MTTATLDQIRELAKTLTPQQKLILIEELVRDVRLNPPVKTPHPSIRGILAHLGPAPSEEDLAEARRAMWSGSGCDEDSE